VISAILGKRVYFRFRLQSYIHTSVSIGVFSLTHKKEYSKMTFLSIWNRSSPCVTHCVRFRKQSECYRGFHSSKKVEKHWRPSLLSLCLFTPAIAQIPFGSSRHVSTTCSTCQARRDERVEPCCTTSATDKMYGLDSVSCRDMTSQVSKVSVS